MTESTEELISKIEKGLVPITIDLVRELREKGYEYQAQLLLEAYHEDKLKNKLQLKKELGCIAAKIHNFEYKRFHPEKIKEWKEKSRLRKLMHKKCKGCKKLFAVPRVKFCPSCKEKHRIRHAKRAEKNRLKRLLESKMCKGCGKNLRVPRLQFHPECLPRYKNKDKLCVYCGKIILVKSKRFHPECLVKHQIIQNKLRYLEKKNKQGEESL